MRHLLGGSGFEDPRSEAEVLIADVLEQSRSEVELASLRGALLEPSEVERVMRAARRRARREPLQHITGRAPFRGLELEVGTGVFTPRPETEGLVETAVERLRQRGRTRPLTVLDLGSGTGAVALGVAIAVPTARVIAVEASAHAWPWLLRNVRRYGAGRVTPVFGAEWDRAFDGEIDAIVSNPPYIPAANVPRDPEVRLHDPAMALYSGADGLDAIRAIAALAARRLTPLGFVSVEHDDHHGPACREVFATAGLLDAATRTDLAGRDRITTAVRAPDYP